MAPKEESQNLTALSTPMSFYTWIRLLLSLASAPGLIKNLTELVFSGFSNEVVLVYLEEIVVIEKDFEEHLERLEQVFPQLKKNNLKTKCSKCIFFQEVVYVLGSLSQQKNWNWIKRKSKQLRNRDHQAT